MNKFFVVLKDWTSVRLEVPPDGVLAVGVKFETLPKARAYATRRASETGKPHFVAEILGAQTAIYDPDIGWEPAEVFDPRRPGL